MLLPIYWYSHKKMHECTQTHTPCFSLYTQSDQSCWLFDLCAFVTGLLHFSLKYNTEKLEPCFLATNLKSTPAAFTFQSWKHARLYHLIRSLLFWDFSSRFLICAIILVVLVHWDKLCSLYLCEAFLSSWRKSWTTCRHGNQIPLDVAQSSRGL